MEIVLTSCSTQACSLISWIVNDLCPFLFILVVTDAVVLPFAQPLAGLEHSATLSLYPCVSLDHCVSLHSVCVCVCNVNIHIHVLAKSAITSDRHLLFVGTKLVYRPLCT